MPEPKSVREETSRDGGRGSLEQPGSLPKLRDPLASVTSHSGPSILSQLIRRVIANPVRFPALGLGFLPRAVSRDFTDGSDGTIQETIASIRRK